MSHCKCSVETCSPSCGECGNPIKDCSPFSSRAAGDADDLAAEVMRLQGELAEARAAGEMSGQWYAEGVPCALCGEDKACKCCDSCKCDHDSEGRIKPEAAGEMPGAVLRYMEFMRRRCHSRSDMDCGICMDAEEDLMLHYAVKATPESLYPRAGHGGKDE